MKRLIFVALLISAAVLVAQDSNPSDSKKKSQKISKDQTTVQGCVSISNGDYILMKQDPAISYELQATGKTRLKNYLGRQVEVTAHQEPSLSLSSDALNKVGSAAPTTLTIISIKTINRRCSDN